MNERDAVVSFADLWEKETRTYDEGTALLLVGARQPTHRVEDLDAGVDVDEYRVCIFLAVYAREQ